MYYVYILRCADGTLYTGVACDLARRLAQHNSGKGAKYTASRRPSALLAAWSAADRSAAQRAERAIKLLTRARKELLLSEEELRIGELSFPRAPLPE